MNSKPTDPGTAPDTDFSGGPGRRLRQAREAAGMDLETAATKLRLDAKTLAAIEAEDYAKLPAPAFVRGYIGNYARLLQLPPEPLIAAYQAQGVAPPQVHPTRRIEDSDPVPHSWWRWLGYGIGVAFILAGVAAYWQGAGTPPVETEVVVEQAPIPTPALPPLLPPPSDDDPDQDYSPGAQRGDETDTVQPGAAQELLGNNGETGDGTEPPADQDTAGAQDLANPEGTETDTLETGGPEVVEVSEQDAPVDALPGMIEPGSAAPETAMDTPGATQSETTGSGAETGAEKTQPTPPAPPPALVLKPGKDAWVSIRDANGKRLVYGIIEAGETKTVVGTPPMRLVVGNAEAVSVTWNGKPFDKAPYTEKGVARFTVGGP